MKRLILSLLLIVSGVLVISFFATLTGDRDFKVLLFNLPLAVMAPLQMLRDYGSDLPFFQQGLMVGVLMVSLCSMLLGHWFYQHIWGKGLLHLGGLIWGASVYVGFYFVMQQL